MFAVIKTGGKQYRVKEGDILQVEKIEGEVGSTVEIMDVLAIGEGEDLKVGTPMIKDAKVVAEILEQKKSKKVLIFKKRRRKGYAKKQGHRQLLSSIRIQGIRV
jgi:large subunit ribosomal protein L21